MKSVIYLILFFLIIGACSKKNKSVQRAGNNNEYMLNQLQGLNKRLTQAALRQDFDLVSDLYLDSCLLLAEYQPMLDGKVKIASYYTEIFRRQDLLDYKKTMVEVFDFNNLILEIGWFKKTFSDSSELSGKYFNTWLKDSNDQLLLRAECFGFYGVPETPADFRVMSLEDDSEPLQGRNGKIIPMEMQAYHAFGENLVRDRDTYGVVESYTDDGIYYPFADTAKTGKKELLKHFTAYHKNPVKIDSIETWSYDYDLVEDGVIRYSKFYVVWTLPNGYTGETSGAGITYCRRTSNNALKKHRQIGTHTLNL